MSQTSIERQTFATRDVGVGEDFIRRTYTDNRLQVSHAAEKFVLSSDLLVLGEVFLGRTRASIDAIFQADEGVQSLTLMETRRPLRMGPGSDPGPVAGGGTMCIAPGVPYRAHWGRMDVDTVTISSDVLDDVAAAQLERGQMLRFDFAGATSAVTADLWRRTSHLVRKVAAANEGHPDSALLADELARTLAGAALTCFANTSVGGSATPTAAAAPESVRRAVAFIESNLDRPLRLTEIAEAARVSPRALNKTFNRYLGTSTSDYVQRVRLDQVHRDLKAAGPESGWTVRQIAARWGFGDPARFSAAYRKAYGRPPSHTLRRSSSTNGAVRP